ncbi:PREDICTED: BPI fold-containing family B member 4-like [Calidris pugnax]|uniref:BPI fold-containing family B member 4-like n=1 Tax=Calidris pugnax TaxID=198806 RepID=UPI00071D9938|nr:PREDICTED: BPI fold-containing family B member 4-like [Calidris pugnax]
MQQGNLLEMTMWKLFGIFFFCGLFSPSQEVLSGLSCAVSPGAMQNVLSDAIIHNGLLQQHLQGLVLPNIVGDGGLLSSPTSITGLHLVKVQLPKLSVVLLSGIGVQLTIAAKLELSGNCLVGLLSDLIDILVDVNITANIKCTNFESGTVQVVIEDCLCILGAIKIKILSGLVGLLSDLIDILVDVNITANIKCTNFESGTVQVVIEDCLCILGAIKIKILSGLLSLSVNDIVLNQLRATLPGLLCPVVDIVINLVNIQLMGTLNAVIPVGTAGTIHYQLASLPFTSGLFLGLDLDGAVKQVGGSIIPHDSSASALPPLLDKLLVLGLRQSFLNAVLSLLIQIPPQTFPCSPEIFSGASRLQEAITTLAPGGCSSCRGTSPLVIKLTLSGNPLILLEENKATVELSVMIQLLIERLDGSILNLLLLKADLGLNALVSIAGGKLVLGLSLGSTSLSLESSDIGISSISNLKPHCSSLLTETFLPLLNGALGIGIPLPNVLGIPLIKVNVQILKGLLVILV